MPDKQYLMESDKESLRLELKTDEAQVAAQATWAGLRAGMRVADLGCGPGRTTAVLHSLAQPGGKAVGIDFSEDRIDYAREQYQEKGISFRVGDIREPLAELGEFDFIWVRFVLEYYLADAAGMVRSISDLLKPGGILCLIDLDNNCLNHYDIPARLERTIRDLMQALQERGDFDPFAGRKLYSHLYGMGFEDIRIRVEGHHVISGELKDPDAFNWTRKVEVAPLKIGFDFPEYAGGHQEFISEFNRFFQDPARFTYSPLIIAAGRKPT